MKIAIFQSELAWENPEENRKNIEYYFRNAPHSFDMFVLPEMFTSGFTMHPQEVAETMEGKTIVWPADGIGTGLAELPKNAPSIHRHIEEFLKRMKETYGE